MPRTKTGSASRRKDGSWWARITYIDEATGKRKEKRKRANNKSHAKELVKQMLKELDEQGSKALESSSMTFGELAEYYKKNYLVEPQYVGERKIKGLRSLRSVITRWEVLKSYFGRKKLRAITFGDLEKFQSIRLNTPTRNDKPRSITSVNRELEVLRKMLNIALREGWILKNPFSAGSLMSKADEKKRERIINKEEEERLLSVCIGRREHLRPILIMALDTGLRRGEILKLRWMDLDFESRLIFIQAMNSKTLKARQVALTERLTKELRALYEKSEKNPDGLVFGITDNVDKAYRSARIDAGLPDVRFHDLRHTYATRLVQKDVPLAEVAKALGHSQLGTTFRYINPGVDRMRKIAAVLDEFHSENEEMKSIIN